MYWYGTKHMHAESTSTDTASGARQYKNYCSIWCCCSFRNIQKRVGLFNGLCCISFSRTLRNETLSYRSSLMWYL